MKEIKYSKYDEVLYTQTLPNGFQIFVLPKPGFAKISAAMNVHFGSLDSEFMLGDRLIQQPAGIAHFLEHQLFDKKGYDVSQIFANNGADVNAFTSYTKTSYTMATTVNRYQNLATLVSFVTSPYFTDDNISKEKGIITQEIGMYQDDPENQLYVKTIQNMYSKTTLADDVAGSVESIQQITKNDLKLAYISFYRPTNMNLFVTGNLAPEKVFEVVSQNFNSEVANEVGQHIYTKKIADLMPESNITTMYKPIFYPKFAIGIRGNDIVESKRTGLKYEIAVSMALDLFFAETATTYNQLFHQNLLDDSFNYEFENEVGFHFAILMGNADDPKQTITALKSVLTEINQKLPQMKNEFELQKKELIGNYLAMMDSENAIVSQFDNNDDFSSTIFDELSIINELNFTDFVTITQPFWQNASYTVTIVEP